MTDRERLDANDYVSLLKAAKAHVNASVLYKRFIDGTPLENDIAVWMADFASDRLDAVERDCQQLRSMVNGATADETFQRQRATDAEAALLSLQTAAREVVEHELCIDPDCSAVKKLAALLHDTAGTIR